MTTHQITDIDKLSFVERKGKSAECTLFVDGYRCRILRFEPGQTIDHHSHTEGKLFKIVLRGVVTYNNEKEHLGEFQLGTVNEDIEYDGKAQEGEEKTFLLLMDPVDSEVQVS